MPQNTKQPSFQTAFIGALILAIKNALHIPPEKNLLGYSDYILTTLEHCFFPKHTIRSPKYNITSSDMAHDEHLF